MPENTQILIKLNCLFKETAVGFHMLTNTTRIRSAAHIISPGKGCMKRELLEKIKQTPLHM